MKNKGIELWTCDLIAKFESNPDNELLICELYLEDDAHNEMLIAVVRGVADAKFELLESIKHNFIRKINNLIDEYC